MSADTPGKRVLILEDEVIVAMDLAQTVEDDGHSVMGPFHDLDSVLAALKGGLPDCALLDVNLGDGRTSEPVARELYGQVPILFLTGYEIAGSSTLDAFPDAQRMPKPLALEQLLAWIRAV